MKRFWIIFVSIALVLLAAVGITEFLVADLSGGIELNVMFMTLAFIGYSITAYANATYYSKAKFRLFPLAGIVASIFGFIATVINSFSPLLLRVSAKVNSLTLMFVSIILAVATAHVSFLLLIQITNPYVRFLRNVTIGIVAIVALMLLHIIAIWFIGLEELYYRILGIFAILDVLGTTLTPLLNRYYSSKS